MCAGEFLIKTNFTLHTFNVIHELNLSLATPLDGIGENANEAKRIKNAK